MLQMQLLLRGRCLGHPCCCTSCLLACFVNCCLQQGYCFRSAYAICFCGTGPDCQSAFCVAAADNSSSSAARVSVGSACYTFANRHQQQRCICDLCSCSSASVILAAVWRQPCSGCIRTVRLYSYRHTTLVVFVKSHYGCDDFVLIAFTPSDTISTCIVATSPACIPSLVCTILAQAPFCMRPFCACSVGAAGCWHSSFKTNHKNANKMHTFLPRSDALGLRRSCGATTSAHGSFTLQHEEEGSLPKRVVTLQRGRAVCADCA
jgi:hypothetical protein